MRLLAERHAADLATAGTREMQPNFCFAPGTPESYIRSVSGQMGGIGKHFRVDDEPGHWEFTATDGANIPRGDAITLTWSIVPDETHIPQFSAGNGAAANSTLRARLDVLYGNEGVWMPLFQQVFDRWEELTGITYVHEPNDDMADFTNGTTNGDSDTPGVLGVRADIRIGGRPIDGDSNTLAFNFGPPTGDMVIDTDDDAIEDMANNSRLFRNMVSHEHGHGLGINHVCPINNTKIMEPIVSRDFDGPQFDDIRAGQRQHGDPMENNDTFAQATNLGVVSDGTITANTVLNGAFLSLDGSDDVDIFKFNVSAPGKTASLTLRPIGSTYLEGAQNPDGSCTVGTTFNSLIVKNLGIELISSDASTVLASADVNGAGQTESIVTIPLPGGTGPFFVRVFGGAVDSVQLYEFDLAVATGSSGALDHFAIETIATPQGVNQTFAVTLNAEDIFNGPAASFNGTVNLSLLARESILIAEIDPGTTDRVEFCNVSERTVDISGWQIVIYDATSGATPASTTTLSAFSSIAPGGVFTLTEDGVASGNLPNLSSGSGIDWSHNSEAITILLLNAGGGIVDFATLGDSSAFSNPVAIPADEWMGPGITDSGSDTYQRTGSADTSTASDWSSAAQTFGSKNVGLSSPFPARPIAFSPTTTGAFSSGMRMETLTFTEPGDKVVLRADDAAGHIGYSNPFDLELVDDISVWLTAVPSSVRAGETITYTATVQNTGPSGATGVMLMDMLPANTAFVSASASQGSVMHDAGSPGTVTANLGALAGGGTATVTINITSSVTGTLMNTVSVARGEADSFAPNNTASASVLIVDGPDNVEEFIAFPGFSGSFSSNPTVAND
ncbi:MAG: putative repeat protein (TIGR01451 family), partial [Limisphaerales bacterium]